MKQCGVFLRVLLVYPPFYLSSAYVFALHDFAQLSVGFVFGIAYYFFGLKTLFSMNADACNHAVQALATLSENYRLDFYKADALFGEQIVACFDPNEKIRLANFSIVNAVPIEPETPALFDANCFHINVNEALIVTSFRGRNFPPLTLYNLLHELKHGSDFGAAHSLQRVETIFRVWLLYFPLATFTNVMAVWCAILAIAMVHYFFEMNYHHGEIASDIFAADVLKKRFGKERAEMVLNTLVHSLRLKLDKAATDKERNYALSRLAGFRKILAGKVPTKMAFELKKVIGDSTTKRVTRLCSVLLIIVGLLVYHFRAPVNLFSLWLGWGWSIALFSQYRNAQKRYFKNKRAYDWQSVAIHIRSKT
jgi:hypothetical protein